ncbi:SDR family oxidoreductase [Segetibacter koreensis]|uniref:SDR family oxidoreductase n=1 Tax=Segetibacter koreensis TaxID=398037 RepID=UPI0003693865|nr:SDR family oxidoreductase [Segetibacter koreensis]
MSVILITGCSTGIGYAAAEKLARNGHTVYATMRNPEGSPQLSQLAEDNDLPITVLPLDVNDEQSIQSTVSLILDNEEAIDVLVNNAGVASWGAAEELPIESFKTDMETNYFGTLRCIKAVLPSMRKRKSGSIINVTSIAAKFHANFFSSYCASKAAVEALSEALAQELKPFNIEVTIVEPGVIKTPIFSKAVKANYIPDNTNYPNVRRLLSFFAASLERETPPSVVADVINDIVERKSNKIRHPAGSDAAGLLEMRASTSDEDWVTVGGIDDDDWIAAMEQMGLEVRKYMQAEELPRLTVDDLSMQTIPIE